MKYYNLIFLLLIFSGCDVSTISDADAKNISKLKAEILIEDGDKKNALNYIKVYLTDGKKQIINADIKVLLNNKPLKLLVRQGNYYDKYSFYSTDSLSRNESYYFEIILPDSTKYPLAFVKPHKEYRNAKFNLPESLSLNEDFVLQWENLNTPYELDIVKGTEVKVKRAENITESAHAGRRIDTLKAKAGKLIIPKSYFEDSLTFTKYLEIKLNGKESGLTNPLLLESSEIIFNHNIEKTIYFKE